MDNLENIETLKNILKYNSEEDKVIVYDFFITYSRIEFALKNAGYVKSDKWDNAIPDWQKFAEEMNNSFQLLLSNKTNTFLFESSDFMFNNPPKHLKFKLDNLTWERGKENNDRSLYGLLTIIKNVRNNLFHGSKRLQFKEYSKDYSLILSSIVILNQCVNLDSRVKQLFLEDIN